MRNARFQSFDDTSDRAATPQRVGALRTELARQGLDGFIVPRADRHQNEYVPASEERLSWLTGFTGSAGVAIVLKERALLFVDGRYQIQARDQVDPNLFAILHLVEMPPEKWIERQLAPGFRLGFDPWLHTPDQTEKLRQACAAAGGAELVPVDLNPLDAVWRDRPEPPKAPLSVHDNAFAGVDAAEKLGEVRDTLDELRADALVVSDPHAVAWLFNVRGADVAHTPLPLAFAFVPQKGNPCLYADGHKISPAVRHALTNLTFIREPGDLLPDLAAFAPGRTLRLDPATASEAILQAITAAGGKVSRGPDPIALLKAVKNDTEIAGARAAHLRDALAMARFLAWFAREAPAGRITEIDAVCTLEDFRAETGLLKDVSFPTIAGSGPHGAIVHYRVTRSTDRRIEPGELFLIDSGAQYEDGTTDVTRTVVIGTPTAEMRDRYTRVLKGHIAIATAVFPHGVTGAQLDTLARTALWRAGLDFDHGTGHGVGSYLSVHEGPARISKLGTTALKAGMILSNEPGYYKTGHYGIRIENLVLVIDAPPVATGELPLYAFETLTLVPYDRSLIAPSLLSVEEVAWIDRYHAHVARTLTPLVDEVTLPWLDAATRPLAG